MTFKKGQSGNPAGRKPGVQDRRLALRALLEPHANDLVAKAVERALEGDVAALRLCLERIIAPAKDAPLLIPNLEGTLTEKAELIVDAMAAGNYPPSTALDLLKTIVAQARVFEMDELERRVVKLEKINDH